MIVLHIFHIIFYLIFNTMGDVSLEKLRYSLRSPSCQPNLFFITDYAKTYLTKLVTLWWKYESMQRLETAPSHNNVEATSSGRSTRDSLVTLLIIQRSLNSLHIRRSMSRCTVLSDSVNALHCRSHVSGNAWAKQQGAGCPVHRLRQTHKCGSAPLH